MENDRLKQPPQQVASHGELESPAHEDIWTSAFDSQNGASAPPPPLALTAKPLAPLDGGGGKGHVRTDLASVQQHARSKALGQELGSNPDAHLGYERLVQIDTDDGRRITLKVLGRTTLDALHGGQQAGIDTQGMSQVALQLEVVGDYGYKKTIQAEAHGTDGRASMHGLIAQLAAAQGIPEELLLPGTADDAYVAKAIAKADEVLPALLRERESPVERLAEPETMPVQAPPKDWGSMTEAERRAEVWATFKAEFSWEEVAMMLLLGVSTMAAMAEVPEFAMIAGVALAELAIAYGVAEIIAPFLEGLNPELTEIVKGGLLIVGGVLALASVMALAKGAAGAAATAAFGAIVAGIAFVVTEAVTANLKYEEAVAATSRDKMQQLARQSSQNAQSAFVDGILALPALKALSKLWKTMPTPTAGAPGEEAMPGREEEVAKPEEIRVAETDGKTAKNPLGFKAIERLRIRFKPNSDHDPVEFSRQLQAQEDGLNKLTVEEYLANRDRYLEEGRSTAGDRAQQEFRELELQRKADELMTADPALTNNEAMEMAEKWIAEKAVLHDPDQVAGGNPLNITGLGDKRVNSSIGAQWSRPYSEGATTSRAAILDLHIREISMTMTPEQKSTTFLNVELMD